MPRNPKTSPASREAAKKTVPATLGTALALALLTLLACQAPAQAPAKPLPKSPDPATSTVDPGGTGQKNSGSANPDKPGTDATSASKPASAGEESASATHLRLGPLDPSVPPSGLPKDRPVIGLALGGGGAPAMSEIGVLQWFDEHHIPVDVIAGTSMGSILAALYSTGRTPDEMKHVMTEDSVNSIFRFETSYTSQNFRRREDSRDIPNSITIGLKHGVSFRNSLLTDTGLNELLDKEFLRYNDQTDFNELPIPFRCMATDLNAARAVTFARGSLQDAVRASASLPGVFRPFLLDGHEYVDGGVLANLPTAQVKAMGADVVLGVSLPLEPVGKGDLDSIVGVLARSFSVAIEAREADERKLATLIIMPDIKGFGAGDYLKTDALAKVGYAAAEANKAALLQYALTPPQWDAYIARRRSRERGAIGSILLVKVKAPDPDLQEIVQRSFAPLVNHPIDTKQVESLLSEVRSDGRYDADYTVGYDPAQPARPIVLVTVSDKKTGPPFLNLGLSLAAQTGGVTRATVDTTFLYQDFHGYGSEIRAHVDFGFYTRVEAEYFWKPRQNGFFLAPRAGISRTPFYIYNGNTRLSQRQSQFGGFAADAGWSDNHRQEVRAGYQFQNVHWTTTTGSDGLPDFHGNAQTVRAQYIFDSQDRTLVPQYGIRSVTSFGYLFGTPGSPSAPQLFSQIELAHTFGKKNVFLLNMEGATMFNTPVSEPFRYTLGGPLRLSASAIDQYRGTDYFLITPGYLRQIHNLGAPLNTNLYLGVTYELGQMRSPDGPTLTRQDIYFGLIAQTPLGVISVAPAFGNASERKFIFTIGKLF